MLNSHFFLKIEAGLLQNAVRSIIGEANVIVLVTKLLIFEIEQLYAFCVL